MSAATFRYSLHRPRLHWQPVRLQVADIRRGRNNRHIRKDLVQLAAVRVYATGCHNVPGCTPDLTSVRTVQALDRWSIDAAYTIAAFFQQVVDDIRAGHEDHARQLLSNLGEPNEQDSDILPDALKGQASGKRRLAKYTMR